jgi:zinc/manganese transport system permease protein
VGRDRIAVGCDGASGSGSLTMFLQYAFLAGTAVALAAGLVGYFLVLRAQVFTGDALSHVSFTGALAALALGLDARVGLFVLTVVVALGLGALGLGALGLGALGVGAQGLGTLGRRVRPDDVVIGGVFAWLLGLGVFFLTLFTTRRSGAGNGSATVTVLFGSIFGLSPGRAATTAIIAVAICLAVLALARPLLFASVDDSVAAARGVPVRLLGFAFLVLVAGVTVEATQVVGALLILGLLAAPAGAANRLTPRPFVALGLSAGIAVLSMWIGLTASHLLPRLPPSFTIVATAAACYALAALVSSLPRADQGTAGATRSG